ncbi:hypothetical protein TRVL_07630 [Trypanosoma vivax]|uniref:Nucleotide-diphospho-sugar transferase domain-containing protein n=1 Tax=Trypanosoma vivax (strain Y486) TaxID=1055687 RepID=F9WUB4_TRYVY|nr:hypothetical protein TRVL_07630 [Trypanosoma vivax]CCD21162.1 hypothetical protein, conserved [Trypanosoma vivax Y486]|eukprot:CCD21162.1 hypothetical protein, conserved [Trypanosoma vivax Y486]
MQRDTYEISFVCTMGTPECDEELQLFLHCFRVVHPKMPIIVGCTSSMINGKGSSKAYREFCDDGKIEWIPCLDEYLPIRRGDMEQHRGVWYSSRHTDFMMEKSVLMEHAMMRITESHANNAIPAVAFLDCDIILLGELPCIPIGMEVALSPHRINHVDESFFGRYNGGFIVASNPSVLYEWRRATRHSRYFDQASLESVAKRFSSTLFEIPPQHNYGYWRLFQTFRADPVLEAKQFSIESSGIDPEWTLCYEGLPLKSIHSHFILQVPKHAKNIKVFNSLMKRWLSRCVRPTSSAALTAAVASNGSRSIRPNRLYEMCLGKVLSGNKIPCGRFV